MRRSIMVLASLVVALAALSSGALAAKQPVKVSGTQTEVDRDAGKYLMHGSLLGKLDTTSFKLEYLGADGQVVGTGTELFKGCHDLDRNRTCDAGEPSGTIRFGFMFWALYNPKTQNLIRGQCVHPVRGGTGDFAKAKGVVHMKDVGKANGDVITTYTGTLEYEAPRSSRRIASAWTPSTSAAPARSASVRGACG